MEEKVRAAIIDELKRQAAETEGLSVQETGDRLEVHGPVDVDAIVMVIAGSVAGGP